MAEISVIGAGKTGRGFVGRLLQEAGKTWAFVDRDEHLAGHLQEEGSYAVRFFGDVRMPLCVKNYTVSGWTGADFSDTELIFVSVGGSNLKDVGAELHKMLPRNRNIYIITCENASDPAAVLGQAVDLPNVHVSQTTVFCTTTEDKGSLTISSENYPYLQYDADRLGDYRPDIKGLKPVNHFGNFLTRKLFTYNAASAVVAYLGYIYGYTDYADAANSPVILALLDHNYAVTNKVLCAEFGYDPDDQREFAQLSRNKFTSTVIKDTVARNAREPQRKLGPDERIIGPMKLIYAHGENPDVLMMTAAAALLYDGEGEDAWREIRRTNTPEQILQKIGGLDPEQDKPLLDGIMQYYRKFEKAGNFTENL
jgi:mannitol-1-phosphate 5-dehydrogenase